MVSCGCDQSDDPHIHDDVVLQLWITTAVHAMHTADHGTAVPDDCEDACDDNSVEV